MARMEADSGPFATFSKVSKNSAGFIFVDEQSDDIGSFQSLGTQLNYWPDDRHFQGNCTH